MTPIYEEYLQGATTWKFSHEGIPYTLLHHGYREAKQYDTFSIEYHPGTWCYYLHVTEQMYPDSWGQFANQEGEYGLVTGPAWDYTDFYGGITFNSDEPFWDRKEKRHIQAVKVGCDYNHLWDMECGYSSGFTSVKQDAINSCRHLLRAFPLERVRCRWSGKWVKPEDSYVAINGATVSRDAELPPEYELWKEYTTDELHELHR